MSEFTLNLDEVPSTLVERREWIRYQLRRARIRPKDLGKEHQLNPSAIMSALNRPYLHGEEILAHALGVRPQDLWPERFDAHGLRLSKFSHCEFCGKAL